VNQTLDIKASDKPVMVFNKIDAYTHLTIDEDDLMTTKTHTSRVEPTMSL
jgi:GTP-binding protein HflX